MKHCMISLEKFLDLFCLALQPKSVMFTFHGNIVCTIKSLIFVCSVLLRATKERDYYSDPANLL